MKSIEEIFAEMYPEGIRWHTGCEKYNVGWFCIRGVGKVHKAICLEESDSYYWEFIVELNDGIRIQCLTDRKQIMDENYFYLKEEDRIEFCGTIRTRERGSFARFNVMEIYVGDVKLSAEKWNSSEVFAWNIKVQQTDYPAVSGMLAVANKGSALWHGMACTGEVKEDFKNNWAYGHLVKQEGDVILHLDKVLE